MACRLIDFLLGHRKVGLSRCYAQPFCITNPPHIYSGIPTTLPVSGFISLQTFLHIATRMLFKNANLINTKGIIMKKIIDKLVLLKFKTSFLQNTLLGGGEVRERRQDTDWEKIFCKRHLIRTIILNNSFLKRDS